MCLRVVRGGSGAAGEGAKPATGSIFEQGPGVNCGVVSKIYAWPPTRVHLGACSGLPDLLSVVRRANLPAQRPRGHGAVKPVQVRFLSGSTAGLRLHPEIRHGAVRRRRCESGQPHLLSWRSAAADGAAWLRLASSCPRGDPSNPNSLPTGQPVLWVARSGITPAPRHPGGSGPPLQAADDLSPQGFAGPG